MFGVSSMAKTDSLTVCRVRELRGKIYESMYWWTALGTQRIRKYSRVPYY